MQGRGVRIFNSSDGLNVGQFGGGVFQKYIEQHTSLKSFHPLSVATLRLTTAIDDSGASSLRAAYLRFGTGKDSHVRSASHIRVPVCKETGQLQDGGYTVDWKKISSHPDTEVKFSGVTIPNFAACSRLVLDLQGKVPFARCVGWDIAIDENEQPVVMEWNGAHNDIKFSEATTGPCFKGLGWENLWKN
ncbi:sugar-transfer associated ATP-grasp domain-containing protein [Rhodovulum bhavnagarense]|uniref:sugar-transfer associated ATP-grasp domain-containing protein n=1 Tax=Rhodovulum bhavnagarense TaxID=992286 RepID=UPI0010468540|nr:sugar-transfer associated ATP-grasp domain-containing protein [Rhodovulum bhavnagarense]